MKQPVGQKLTLREKFAQLPVRTKRQLLLVGAILLILIGQHTLSQLGARLRQIIAVDAQFSFQPATGNLAFGQNLPLILKLNVDTHQLVFSHVEVIFDPARVKLASEVTALNSKLSRKPIPITPRSSANVSGRIVMALGAEPTSVSPPPTGMIDLAELTFTPTATVSENTNTQITVSFVDTKLANSQTQSIPVSTLGGSATITLLAAGPTPTPIPTPVASPSDTIFSDGFESGNTSAWSSETDAENDLTVSTAARLVGSQGLAALIDNTTSMYVRSDHPVAEPRYRARFYFDPNSITMASADIHSLFNGRTASGANVFTIQFNYTTTTTPPSYRIRPQIYNNAGSATSGSYQVISDAPHYIEIDWQADTAAGATNGALTLWIDGVLKQTMSTIDNETLRVEEVRLGPLTGLDAGTLGTYFLDAFESRKTTYIGPALLGDLSTVFVLTTPTTPLAGGTFSSVRVTVKNLSNEVSVPSHNDKLTFSFKDPNGATFCDRTDYYNLSLGPGVQIAIEFDGNGDGLGTFANCPGFTPGSNSIVIQVDASNLVAESNETNNTFTHTFSVASPVATPVPTPTPIPTPSPIAGLKAAYAFNEGLGSTASDSSGQGRNLNLSNTVWASGHTGSALTFDGSISRASDSTVTHTAFTYMAWVFNPTNEAHETIMTIGPSRELYLTNGIVGFNDGGFAKTWSPAISNNTWHHIAIHFDGCCNIRAYLNGTWMGTTYGSSAGNVTDTIHIGALPSGASFTNFFNGTIDEVRIFDSALGESEIQTYMNTSP